MTKGILIIAFGNYLRFAIRCLRKRKTKIPVTVLISATDRIPKQIPEGVEIVQTAYQVDEHRSAKTQMISLTPYDYTLYLDADCMINKELQGIFDLIVLNDLVLNSYDHIYNGSKTVAIYKRAIEQFDCTHPLKVFNGALVGFQKNEKTRKFFNTWNSLWIAFGSGREMPLLACSVQKTGIKVGRLKKGYFAPDQFLADCHVQHYYTGFEKQYGMTKMLHRAITKHDSHTDWTWVAY